MRKTELLGRVAAVLTLAAVLVNAGCASSQNPDYDPSKPHHTPTGFVNLYPPNPAYQRPQQGVMEAWIARLRNWTRDESHTAPLEPLVPAAPDLEFIHGNKDTPAVTWINHATVLIQTGSGLTIITDPIFSDRASPLPFAGPKRQQAPGLSLEQLPHIDVVLISHNHYDHLDLASVRALHQQKSGRPPRFIAPLGVDRWLAEHVTDGDRSLITKLDWWDSVRIGDTDIHLLPVHHWSARSLWDRSRTLWGAYAVLRDGFSFWFSGDLAYSKNISDIAARFDGFDLAAIGVGAYQPIWYRNSHASPEEAVLIHKELRIKRSFPIHFGTFPMGHERLDDPPRDLAIARKALQVPDDEFIVLKHGETLRLGGRLTAQP